MSDEETRVVLVKPGDVLAFGNIPGDFSPLDVARAGEGLKRLLKLKAVLFFRGDVTMRQLVGDVEPCPECRGGKCVNCCGETMTTADELVPCPCKEAGHG